MQAFSTIKKSFFKNTKTKKENRTMNLQEKYKHNHQRHFVSTNVLTLNIEPYETAKSNYVFLPQRISDNEFAVIELSIFSNAKKFVTENFGKVSENNTHKDFEHFLGLAYTSSGLLADWSVCNVEMVFYNNQKNIQSVYSIESITSARRKDTNKIVTLLTVTNRSQLETEKEFCLLEL